MDYIAKSNQSIPNHVLAEISEHLKAGGRVTVVCHTGKRWPVTGVKPFDMPGRTQLTLGDGRGAISYLYEGDVVEFSL